MATNVNESMSQETGNPVPTIQTETVAITTGLSLLSPNKGNQLFVELVAQHIALMSF
jgi:hypothetical protein